MGSALRRCLGPNSNTAKIFDGELAAEDGHEAITEHHPHIDSDELTGALHTGKHNISRFRLPFRKLSFAPNNLNFIPNLAPTTTGSYDRLNGAEEVKIGRNGLTFFCRGKDTANQAARMTGSIDRLFHADKEKIKYFERGAASALLVYRYAQANPLFAIEPSENFAILSHLPLITSYSGAVKLVGHLVADIGKH
jgi:hypothetical protein